jgi:murein DD-endopeptidase MepM/ murein hydrolase activator NlpD
LEALLQRIVIELEADGGAGRRFALQGTRLKRVAWAIGAGVTSLIGLLFVLAFHLGAYHGNGPSARSENVVLRGRLEALSARLERVDRALDRVTAHDAKIRGLTREDEGARAFGIGPLSELEVAAADRDGGRVVLPGDAVALESGDGGVGETLDDLDARADAMEAALVDEEQSLQEVRSYLEDRTSLLRAHPTVWPVRGWVTSRFGYRSSPEGTGSKMHGGIDIAAPRGTPVIASGSGNVVFAGYHSGYGNLVVVDHGYGITTRHAHLSRLHVKVGQRVQRGDLLGRVGNTGRSTGPHLHFEVWKDGVPTNPANYLSPEG